MDQTLHLSYNTYWAKMQNGREISRGDVAAVCFFVNLVAQLFPEFSYRWVSGRFSER